MSEMVERVARAISAKHDWKEWEQTHDESPPWSPYIDDARAAIAAMRNPTEEMVIAVAQQYGPALEADYQAMIDGALK